MSRRVLVTGASSGIGKGTVEVLCAAGYTVHAVARRENHLHTLAERTGCTTHATDVTDSEAVTTLIALVRPEIVICLSLIHI